MGNVLRHMLIKKERLQQKLSRCCQVKCITLADPQMSFNTLPFQENLDYFCFLIFLFFCAASGLFVRFNVPETKNRTALEIATEFEKIHCKSQTKSLTAENLNEVKTCETKF